RVRHGESGETSADRISLQHREKTSEQNNAAGNKVQKHTTPPGTSQKHRTNAYFY
ncbi:hypothetical protein LSAT2_005166, partial [Lamellibrachia satsuma]